MKGLSINSSITSDDNLDGHIGFGNNSTMVWEPHNVQDHVNLGRENDHLTNWSTSMPRHYQTSYPRCYPSSGAVKVANPNPPACELIDSSADIANSVNSNGVFAYHESSDRSHSLAFTVSDSCEWHESVLTRSVRVKHGSSWLVGVLIMSNVSIGIGTLNFPSAYANGGGIIPGVVMQLLMMPMVVLSLYMVGYSCKYYGATTYQDMVATHCGRLAGIICRILIFLDIAGVTLVMIVVLGDQLDRIFLKSFGEDFQSNWYLRRTFSVPCVCTFVILPLSCLKDFHLFHYTSYLGLFASFYLAIGVALTRYITTSSSTPIDPDVLKRVLYDGKTFWTNQGFVNLLPALTFAYEAHTEIPIMQACLKRKSLKYYMRMVFAYCGIATVIYILCGVFPYLTYPDLQRMNSDMLLIYDKDDFLVDFAMGLVIFKAITTIPIYVFCLRTVLDSIWEKSFSRILPTPLNYGFNRRIIQVLLILPLCVFLGAVVPSMTTAISLIGGLSGTFMFTIPGLCFLQAQLRKAPSERKLWRYFASLLLITWGAFVFGVISTLGIMGIIRGQ